MTPWLTMSIAFEMTPPAPAIRFVVVGSWKMIGMRRPVKIHDWLMCPVASASVRLYVVEVILRGAKMRSVTNSWKVIPEYVLMTSGRKMYICSITHELLWSSTGVDTTYQI